MGKHGRVWTLRQLLMWNNNEIDDSGGRRWTVLRGIGWPSHGGNRGSNPLGDANLANNILIMFGIPGIFWVPNFHRVLHASMTRGMPNWPHHTSLNDAHRGTSGSAFHLTFARFSACI